MKMPIFDAFPFGNWRSMLRVTHMARADCDITPHVVGSSLVVKERSPETLSKSENQNSNEDDDVFKLMSKILVLVAIAVQ